MNSHLKSYPLFFLHSCSVSCQQHLCVCTWRLKFLVRGLSNLLNESQLGPSPPPQFQPSCPLFLSNCHCSQIISISCSFPITSSHPLQKQTLYFDQHFLFKNVGGEEEILEACCCRGGGKQVKLVLRKISVSQQSYCLIWKRWIPCSPKNQEVLSKMQQLILY